MSRQEGATVRRPGTLIHYLPAVGTVVVVLTVLAVASPNPTAPIVGTAQWTAADTWSNGFVQASLSNRPPAVTVSSGAGEADYGMYAGIGSLSEVDRNGSVRASANVASFPWPSANSSSLVGLAVSYSAVLPVEQVSDHQLVGDAQVYFNVSSSTSAPPGQPAQVRFAIIVANWPWRDSADAIAIGMPLWPEDTHAAALARPSNSASTVECRSMPSGTVLETFEWAPTAEVTARNGSTLDLPAVSAIAGDANLTTVTVTVGAGHGGFSQLAFDPTVSVPVPAQSGGISTPILVVSVGAAVVASALGLVGLRRVWTRPPSLERWEDHDA